MRRVINILVIFVLADLALAGALWYGHATMQDMKSEEIKLRNELAAESQSDEKLATLEKTRVLAEAAHERMTPFFFGQDEESQIRFVSLVEELGRETAKIGIETKTFEFTAPSAKVAPVYRGTFEINGSWPELYHFLRLIEEFPARIIIERFESRTASGGASSGWQGSMTLSVVSISPVKQ